MKREALVGLITLIAIVTFAVSSVDISLGAEEPQFLKDISIEKIEVNITELESINGEVTAVLFNMSVTFMNYNQESVMARFVFEVSGEGTGKFIYRERNTSVLPKRLANEVIKVNEVITDKYIIAYLLKEDPIIYVHCASVYTQGHNGGYLRRWEEQDFNIEVHNGSGVWRPPPISVSVIEALQERTEMILAIAGLVVVAYMLLQPKRKKNLKTKIAARLGLLCVGLNFFSLGILNPFYFIFIVAAILAYCCLLLKQKWSATLVMFVYSIIGAAIMTFFYLLFDVTSEWDYLYLARFVASALYLVSPGVPGWFILTILFGVSIGIIADIIYAILKGNEVHAAVVIGLVIALVLSFIFIGMLSSLPGPSEGPIFIIAVPMIVCGVVGGYLGYIIFNKRRKTEAVLKILES